MEQFGLLKVPNKKQRELTANDFITDHAAFTLLQLFTSHNHLTKTQ